MVISHKFLTFDTDRVSLQSPGLFHAENAEARRISRREKLFRAFTSSPRLRVLRVKRMRPRNIRYSRLQHA